MRLTLDNLEDIITVGEAKAAKENSRFKVYLLYEKPEPFELDEGKKGETLGFYIQYRPQKDEIREGLFDRTADESEIYDYWQVEGEAEKGLRVGLSELVERKVFENSFLIRVDGKTYASWESFAKDFGLTELVAVATKIPKPLAIKLQKITEEEGETMSWRLRLLIQEYLTERIKDRVRRVMFQED